MENGSKEILNFIKHFQNEGAIKIFTEGCCYWFAYVLQSRFFDTHECRLMYNQVTGHFCDEIDGVLYDITGVLEDDGKWEEWVNFYFKEPDYGDVVVRDCILKDPDWKPSNNFGGQDPEEWAKQTIADMDDKTKSELEKIVDEWIDSKNKEL